MKPTKRVCYKYIVTKEHTDGNTTIINILLNELLTKKIEYVIKRARVKIFSFLFNAI